MREGKNNWNFFEMDLCLGIQVLEKNKNTYNIFIQNVILKFFISLKQSKTERKNNEKENYIYDGDACICCHCICR